MSLNGNSARALLIVGICIAVSGLAFFALAPLVAMALIIVGAGITVVAAGHWATRSGKTPHHYAQQKKSR